MLKDILAAMEKYEAAEKHVKEVEAKVRVVALFDVVQQIII